MREFEAADAIGELVDPALSFMGEFILRAQSSRRTRSAKLSTSSSARTPTLFFLEQSKKRESPRSQ
jgi:hypothetical protein